MRDTLHVHTSNFDAAMIRAKIVCYISLVIMINGGWFGPTLLQTMPWCPVLAIMWLVYITVQHEIQLIQIAIGMRMFRIKHCKQILGKIITCINPILLTATLFAFANNLILDQMPTNSVSDLSSSCLALWHWFPYLLIKWVYSEYKYNSRQQFLKLDKS